MNIVYYEPLPSPTASFDSQSLALKPISNSYGVMTGTLNDFGLMELTSSLAIKQYTST